MVKLKVGDRVQYSREFLRSTGMLTGEVPFARGVVISLENLGARELVTIAWNFPEVPSRVLDCNLVRIGEIENV